MRFLKWAVLLFALSFFHTPGVWADTEDLDFLQYKEGECDLKKAEAQAREMSGWTTITLAVLNNDLPKTKALLEAGADINTTDTFHRSLLLLACMHDLDDMARFLVERGADVNKAVKNAFHSAIGEEYSYSPFTEAVERNDYEMAEYLLKEGAKIDCRYTTASEGERTPLGRAICEGHVEAVRFLMEHGAAPQTEENTRAVFRLAFKRGNRKVMQYLHEKYTRDGKDLASFLGMPPLFFAVKLRRLEIADYFLSAGASLDQTGPEGRTLLTQAVQADFNSLDWNDKPERWVEMLRFLVKKGADLKPTLPANRLLLSDAISVGNHPAVQYLLEHGYSAQKSIQTRDEGTTLPLVYAVLKGQVDCARILVKAGADPRYKSGKGQSLLDLVGKTGDQYKIARFKDLLDSPNKQNKSVAQKPADLEVYFKSKSYDKDSTGTYPVHPNQFKIMRKVVGDRTAKDESDQYGNYYYYLTLKGSPDSIPMLCSMMHGKQSDPYLHKNRIFVEWFKKGSLIKVTYEDQLSGTGFIRYETTLFLLVKGNRLQPIYRDEFEKFSRGGPGDRSLGNQEWSLDSLSGDILLTRTGTEEVTQDARGTFLARNIEGHGFRVDSQKSIYRFRLEEKNLRCISMKKYQTRANELPLVNIATKSKMTLTELWKLNPGQKGRVFCNGTVYLGESKSFKPNLRDGYDYFPRMK